jgi:hypothetical protein
LPVLLSHCASHSDSLLHQRRSQESQFQFFKSSALPTYQKAFISISTFRNVTPSRSTSTKHVIKLDDMFYDASEEESEFEMDMTAGFEKPVPILDALPRKRTAVGETIEKTLPEQKLAQIPAGYSTSDNDSGQSEYCRFDADHGPNHLAAQGQRTTAGYRVLRTRHPVSEREGIASEEAKRALCFEAGS